MTVEIECKVAVEDHEPVRGALRRAGAEPIACVIETNRIYDRPGGELAQSGCGLRVRTLRPLEGPPPPATLTFKGPVLPGEFKQREEIEISHDDGDALRRLLAALGFEERIAFEKHRESWRLENCRVELDELPRAGRFVEVEGPDEPSIRRVLDRIGLAGRTSIRHSYVALVAAQVPPGATLPWTLTFGT